MKSFIYALLLCVSITYVQAQSQKPVKGDPDQENQILSSEDLQFSSAPKAEFFSSITESATKSYSNIVKGGVILTFDSKKTAEFFKGKSTARFTMELPTGKSGKTMQLNMQRSQIFSKDFKILTSSNPGIPYEYEGGLHYQGVVNGDSKSKVAISVFDNEIMGLIITSKGTYNLGRLKNSAKNHILYLEEDMLKKPEFSCSMHDDNPGYTEEILHFSPRDAGDCVSVYLEVDQSVVLNKGSVANAANFVIAAFNQNVLLYNAEMINMNISQLFIWDSPDPYAGPSSSQYLDQFQANTEEFNGDLGHLVAMVNNGGIAAGFSGICNPDTDQSLCYSGILDFYEDIPVFSFTVMILAHEMGHLLGSRHTHACVWNGNNTAIDGCAGFVETDVALCALPGSPAGGGTIMSYCHSDPVGVNFAFGFGPQPGNVIRNTIANASCLNSVCISCDLEITNITETDPTSCDMADGTITISATSSNTLVSYSIDGPVNLNNTTGIFTGLPFGSYSIIVEDSESCLALGNATLGTFSADVPKAISSSGTPTVTSVLNFGGSGAITSIKLKSLDISHTWVGDLSATLTSPEGTIISLFNRPGNPASVNGCSANNIRVDFDDSAVLTASDFENTCVASPIAIQGTFQSITPLSTLLGEESNGIWTLTVMDAASADGGSINTWGLEICNCDLAISNITKTDETCPGADDASITVTASSSELPIMYSISGPANQSNSTGIFSNLPSGMYNLIVSDNNNCEVSTNISIVTEVDNAPPVIQCFNQEINFNGEPEIPLDSDDLVEADDNCGVQSISLSPSVISSTQAGQTVPVNVTVTDLSGNTATCVSQIAVDGLPQGWSQNVNGVGCNDGNFIDYNAGSNVWTATSTNCYYSTPFTSDANAFAQYELCGNGSITAQVTGISGALGWAGVVMRESNAPGAKKAQLTTNMSSNQSRREFRVITNGGAVPQQFPSQNKFWLRIVRTGNQFAMFSSSNGVLWSPAGSQNITMGSCIQIGLVATNYTSNSTVIATFANVDITDSNVTLPVWEGDVINQEMPTLSFEAYPNPSSGVLNLSLVEYTGRDVLLEVYSIMGQLLLSKEIIDVQTSNEMLDLSAFTNGLYFIRAKSEGLPQVTKRVTLTK